MKYLQLCAFVLAVCFCAGALLDFGHQTFFSDNGIWQPSIMCEKPVHDFGTISGDTAVSCRFVVTNVGDRDLKIREVDVSCGSCIKVISYPMDAIRPGDSDAIQVSFLPTNLRGLVEKSLSVLSNDPRKPWVALKVRAALGNTCHDHLSAEMRRPKQSK